MLDNFFPKMNFKNVSINRTLSINLTSSLYFEYRDIQKKKRKEVSNKKYKEYTLWNKNPTFDFWIRAI